MKKSTAFCLTVAILCCSSAQADELNVNQLHPGNVIGALGKPLGTKLTIEGVRAERVMLSNPLAIASIDGAGRKQPLKFEIRGPLKLEKGVTYRLEGYESGEFASAPSWHAPGAQQPFQFYSYFIVTKVLAPEPVGDEK